MIAQATRCYDCGSYVSRDIYFGRFGKRNNVPLWVCPNCGVVHEDYRWFKYVSQQEANAIIEHRGPRGLFVLETGVEYIGIDNSTGDAWTEEFPGLIERLKEREQQVEKREAVVGKETDTKATLELATVKAERDTYRRLYEDLIRGFIPTAPAGA